MLLSVVDVYFNKFKDTMIRLNYFRSVAKHAMKWWQNRNHNVHWTSNACFVIIFSVYD